MSRGELFPIAGLARPSRVLGDAPAVSEAVVAPVSAPTRVAGPATGLGGRNDSTHHFHG